MDAKAAVSPREHATPSVEFDRFRHRACFCPVCFQAEPVWRDEWQRRGVLACLLHGVRLVAECPICRKSLSWRRRDLGHCSCGFPLPLWPREVATDGEVAATRYVLLSEGPTGKTRCGWTGLPRQARVFFLRALGYAWLGEAVTARQRLGKLDDREARAFSAAGDAILSLMDPVSFLVQEFAEGNDSKFFELQKLVAIEFVPRHAIFVGLGDGLRVAPALSVSNRKILRGRCGRGSCAQLLDTNLPRWLDQLAGGYRAPCQPGRRCCPATAPYDLGECAGERLADGSSARLACATRRAVSS